MKLSWRVRGSGLRATREARGVSRSALALMVGASQTEIAAIEGQCAPVSSALRPRLMRALDAGFEQLFTVEARDPFGRRYPTK